jgi:hypothetical protein
MHTVSIKGGLSGEETNRRGRAKGDSNGRGELIEELYMHV